MRNHAFTAEIHRILQDEFGSNGALIFERSYLLQYLNEKTVSANQGSKSRGAFGNHYAIYVLTEDYISRGYLEAGKEYRDYEGASFAALLARLRELPFGRKIQNHALNSRCNEEFRKFFPSAELVPIIRDLNSKRYWINEALLKIECRPGFVLNIGRSVIQIIDAYVAAKTAAFDSFILACQQLNTIDGTNNAAIEEFIKQSMLEFNYEEVDDV